MDPRIRKLEVIDDRVVEILRKKTPAERLAIVDGLWRFARDQIHAIIAREHPDWPEDEVRRQVARRMSQGVF